MEIYSVISEGYKYMYIITDTLPAQNQLDIYLNKEKLGSFVTSFHSNPPLDTLSKPLEFISTLTSLGAKYVFIIEPTDIGQTDYFKDGVYHFELSTEGNSILPIFGAVSDRELLCCMAGVLVGKDSECEIAYYNKVNINHALLQGSKAAIRLRDVDSAVCQFKAASCECKTCN